jgi:hypothetical protein
LEPSEHDGAWEDDIPPSEPLEDSVPSSGVLELIFCIVVVEMRRDPWMLIMFEQMAVSELSLGDKPMNDITQNQPVTEVGTYLCISEA